MIIRIWRCSVSLVQAQRFLEVFRGVDARLAETHDGYRGVSIYFRDQDDRRHFVIQSTWESMEAISRYADQQFDQVKLFPEFGNVDLHNEAEIEHLQVLAEHLHEQFYYSDLVL